MPVWGKKKNKLSKSDSLDEDDDIPASSFPSNISSSKEKKSSFKRLFPKRTSKKKKNSKNNKNSRIGEIPKPIIPPPSDGVGSTNTTPLKENRKKISLDKDIIQPFTPKSRDKNMETTPQNQQRGTVHPGNSFSSADTIDSEMFDVPESPINHNSQDEHDFHAHFDNVYSPSSDDNIMDHMKRLKSLSKFHVEENFHGIQNPKSLGDDLTVSTATHNQISPNLPPGIYVPNYPEMPNTTTNAHKHRNFNAEDLYNDQRQKDKLVSLTRSALRRASNRSSLPAHLAKKWNVEISPPIKDTHTQQHQFTIRISDTRFQAVPLQSSFEKIVNPPTATTKRSLQDFCWLENALRNEYHGGFLVPLLSMSLGVHGWFSPHTIDKWHTMPKLDGLERLIEEYTQDQNFDNSLTKNLKDRNKKDKKNRKHPMEKVLAEWLSDILNGVRGHGEWIMNLPNHDRLNIMTSESMETFLYRHTDPLPVPTNQSQLDFLENRNKIYPNKSKQDEKKDFGFIQEMVQKSILCFAPSAKSPFDHYNDNTDRPKINAKTVNLPLVDMLNCQSPTANSDNQNHPTDLQYKLSPSPSSKNRLETNSTVQNEFISCQSDLLLQYRKVSLACLTKIHSLIQEEDQRNNAWKRLAISVTNLFSFEKDIEMTELGEEHTNKSDSSHPNTKKGLSKSSLEAGLRQLTRQKKDRAIPSLKVLNCLIEAYVEDLSMVSPGLLSHLEAMDSMIISTTNEHVNNDVSNINGHDMNRWDLNLKQLSDKFTHVKQQINLKHFQNDSMNQDSSNPNPILSSAYRKVQKAKIHQNEEFFQKSLTKLIKSIPIRIARMAWTFFKLETVQASLLKEKAMKLKLGLSKHKLSHSKQKEQKVKEDEKEDDEFEYSLLEKIAYLGTSQEFLSSMNSSKEKMRTVQSEKVLRLAREQVGRWNANVAMAVMETAGVEDADVRVEEFTRDLRIVRKYAIGLREKIERCVEAVDALMMVTVGDVEDLEENIEVMNGGEFESPKGLRRTVSIESSYEPSSISSQIPLYKRSRNELLSHLAVVFSGAQVDLSPNRSRKDLPNPEILANLGIDTNDPTGWLGALSGENRRKLGAIPIRQQRGNCGKVASNYFKVREANVADLLSRISKMLREYVKRIEGIESFVYMHCVGIQIEKHFEKRRKKLVEAWGMKTDINTAINLATKKNLPDLVDELNSKLEALSYVSHTAVKQAKDKHLTSKTLKSDLQDLANRRFARAKKSSMQRVTSIIKMWLGHEETVALEEMKSLSSSIREIERTVTEEEIKADGGAHLFAFVE